MNDRLPRAVALTALAALAASCTGGAATPAAAPAATQPATQPATQSATQAVTRTAADWRYLPPPAFDGVPSVPDSAFVKLIRSGVAKGDLPATAVGTSYISADQARKISIRAVPQHNADPAGALDDLLRKEFPKGDVRAHYTDVDPGGRGGAMRCDAVRGDEGTVTGLCFWSDGSMVGIYGEYVLGTDLGVDTTARHTRDFRVLAEVPS
ncbi:hypothetical protein GCM10018790_30350 [Kitasatospora xanthocidica]|uniref:hypothetical protein n=1 Tax=Kitasatospora xanthocidica TaxID=83382 RepID=UPI0016745095|nr:hypothetical protein [Kitasatospora xanthocidica]GHF50481.1 hypothetical protein GCM10018790_30350 [Kitasatospora xanthocidica]